MKKLLIPSLLAALLAACSTTPLPEDGNGAPVESRNGSSVAPVVAGGMDANGLPRELTDPKSKLAQRSIYFDLDKYDVKGEYQDLAAAHGKTGQRQGHPGGERPHQGQRQDGQGGHQQGGPPVVFRGLQRRQWRNGGG